MGEKRYTFIEEKYNNGEFLSIIYNQCNEHLREQGKKRDQILAFFATFTGLFLGNVDKFKGTTISLTVISTILSILGFFLAFVLIKYKSWHEKYVIGCIVLQKGMMSNSDCVNSEMLNEFLLEICKKKLNKFKVFLWSTETITFNIYVIVSFLNIYILLSSLNVSNYLVILAFLSYIFLLNYISYLEMKRVYQIEKIQDIWILNI